MSNADEAGKIGKHLVFVYGTLKRNLPNHYWLCDEAKGKATFVGEATTSEKFPLVIASDYHIPCLLYVKDKGHHIKGEIYEVDDKMLGSLDELEEHPEFYERSTELVVMNSENSKSSQSIEAWIYFIKKFKASFLDAPMLDDYQNSDVEKLYIARYLRDKDHRADILP